MLKIGVIRWRGKCPRHPMFDPYIDGAGAIRGGCERCSALLEIHKCHQKMLALMKGFAPASGRKTAAAIVEDLQESLF